MTKNEARAVVNLQSLLFSTKALAFYFVRKQRLCEEEGKHFFGLDASTWLSTSCFGSFVTCGELLSNHHGKMNSKVKGSLNYKGL